jgi:hypothetical protein
MSQPGRQQVFSLPFQLPIAKNGVLELSGLESGLPDGIFSNQKSQFWVNFGGS